MGQMGPQEFKSCRRKMQMTRQEMARELFERLDVVEGYENGTVRIPYDIASLTRQKCANSNKVSAGPNAKLYLYIDGSKIKEVDCDSRYINKTGTQELIKKLCDDLCISTAGATLRWK